VHIQGKKIFLRSVLPSDADILYTWENDTSNWDVSETKKPFTKKEIGDFIADQKDIYLDKQLRLMVCIASSLSEERKPVGCIDIFKFDIDNLKAGIGVLTEEKYRNTGYASEALSLLIKYCFETLHLRHLYCHITESNLSSMKLFQKHNFVITGKEGDICTFELGNKIF
jgi:diamine N-acetyltransferase